MQPGTPILFNGTSLQTDKIFTGAIKGMTTKIANLFVLSHANQSKIPNTEYPNKVFTVSGQIVGSNIVETDSLIDSFYDLLRAQNAILDIGWAGGFRRYTATAMMPDIERPGGLTFANFTVTFICTQPFGQDVTPTTVLSATGRTNAGYSDAYTFLGTAPFQLPITTVTFTALTGATAKSVVVGNNNTSQAITVTRTWNVGDILQINSITSTVTVNGVQVDFTGAFPTFQPGLQSLGYADSFTTRTFNITTTYNVMYI